MIGGVSPTEPVTTDVEKMVSAVRSTLETAKRIDFDAFIPVSYRKQVCFFKNI